MHIADRMPICKRTIPVSCRLEDAFQYISVWSNLKDFMPMFVDMKPVSLVHYGPGLSLETMFALSKMEISTELDLVEFVRNKRILFKSSRGIRSKVSWDLAPLSPVKTLISFAFEYEIPPALVTRPSEKEAIEKELQEHANRSMDLLKWILESKDREGL